MNRIIYICCLVVTFITLSGVEGVATAQYHKERGMVRDGNEQFNQRNYRRSLNYYNSAVVEDSTSYEALYNRANAYYQMVIANPDSEEYSFGISNSYYEKLAADTLLSDTRRAEAYRNLGESLFAQQNYEAALNSFRESLRLNPNDKETKYDYVLTKRIVDQKRQSQQNQDQKNNDQNQDQKNNGNGGDNQQNKDNSNNDQKDNSDNNNKDNKQEGDNNEEKDNKENKDNKGNSDKNKDGDNQPKDDQNGGDDKSDNDKNKDGNPEESESNTEPQPRELNPDQRRMLDAIQAEEDKTEEKMKEEAKGIVVKGKKNW